MNSTSDEVQMEMDQYQELAKKTDQTLERKDKLAYGLLGLFGEVGTLLSALKKNLRDRRAYVRYEKDVLEEFGDVLWYFSTIASGGDLKLSEIARIYFGTQSQSIKEVDDLKTFTSAQERCLGASEKDFEGALLRLAAKVGLLVDDFNTGNLDEGKETMALRLSEVFGALMLSANRHKVSLNEAVQKNIEKTQERWPDEEIWSSHFDAGFEEGESFSREMVMHIIPRKTHKGNDYVVQQLSGVNIGDRLTDNKIEPDGYRFHDVIHMGFIAVLGWSPVMRGLLKLKRKSKPEIDHAEDGLRAISLEEGISTWIFNYANKLQYFEGLDSVDYSLLKTIREIVNGFEVGRCPVWQWEKAILEGFRVFAQLREHNGGIVTIDMNNHVLKFEALPHPATTN